MRSSSASWELHNRGPASNTKVGYAVSLRFTLDQHIRDRGLIQSIKNYLNCGNLIIRDGSYVRFSVWKFGDIINIVIPLLEKYPLVGIKKLDFNDLYLISKLMSKKSHLTTEGLSEIQKIKAGMNKSRGVS